MRTTILVMVMAFGFAHGSMAQTRGQYIDWAEGPVRHLMTNEEIEQWRTLQSEAAAKDFIDLFWAKRDPTPATRKNELREEFDKRVALADEHFTTKRTRGALTDRGRAMILLGAPFQVGNKGPARGAAANPRISSVDQWDGQVRGPRGDSALLTWTYARDKKPRFINRKDFEILFVDDAGDGQWQFAITPRNNPEVFLQEAIRAYISSPDLTKPPVFGTITRAGAASLQTPALRTAYEQFRSDPATRSGPAVPAWGQFVTPDGEIFVAVQLFVPDGSGIEAGRRLTFFGVVEDAAGETVKVFEDPVELVASLRDAYVDKSLSLGAGTYKATFGLAENGRVLTMAKTEMTIDQLDPKASAISDLILSNNTFPLPHAQNITDPFAFGGLKVVPKADAVFRKTDDIWYFHELRNPGLGDSGSPKVQAKIVIEGKTEQGKPVKLNFPLQEFPAIPLKGVENHYGYALSIPLTNFEPGTYKVKIRVIDTVLKKSYESEKPFDVRL